MGLYDELEKYFTKDDRDEEPYKTPGSSEDKTPYDSVSARDPISDPRGRNPMNEERAKQGLNVQTFTKPMIGDMAEGSVSTTPEGNPLHDFTNGPDFGAMTQQLNDSMPNIRSNDPNPATDLQSSVKKAIQMRQGMGLGMADAPHISHFQNEKVFPPTSGKPLDLSEPDDSQQAGSVPPGSSPMPPSGATPASAPSGGNDDLFSKLLANQDQSREDLRASALAPGAGYYLAGVQGAQGAMKPQNQNALGDYIAGRNKDIQSGLQNNNNTRNAVLQAIALQKGNQAFTSGQNDLNRANTFSIAQLKANKPSGNQNAQSNFERKFAQSQQVIDQRNEQNANTLYSKETAPYTQSLDSANRLQHVLDNIKSGVLTSSSNVAASMESDMSQLLTNSKSTTVSDKQHAAINALSSTWSKIVSYAKSKPMDTIPQAYLDQYEQELNILKGSTIDAYRRKTNELKSGTSNSTKQGVFQNRFDTQVNSQNLSTKHPNMQNMVSVTSPQGVSGKIPRASLEAAQKEGYTLNEQQLP